MSSKIPIVKLDFGHWWGYPHPLNEASRNIWVNSTPPPQLRLQFLLASVFWWISVAPRWWHLVPNDCPEMPDVDGIYCSTPLLFWSHPLSCSIHYSHNSHYSPLSWIWFQMKWNLKNLQSTWILFTNTNLSSNCACMTKTDKSSSKWHHFIGQCARIAIWRARSIHGDSGWS